MRSTWRIGFASACLIAALSGDTFARQSSAPKQAPAKPASSPKAEWETLNQQAMTLYKAEKLDEARSMLTQALAAAERERGPESSSVAQVLNELGFLDNAQKKYADAEPRLLRSAAIVEKLAGKENANLASIYQGLGNSYAGQGKYADAETAYLHALAIGEKSFGHDDPKLVPILQGYASALRKMGQNERAIAMDARVSLIRGEPTPSPAATDSASTSAAPVPTAPSFEDARAAYARGDVARAVKMFQELADRGNPHAQAVLGDLYLNGEGVPKDATTAIQWYRKSAEQGFPGAQLNLGVCYEKGLGVKKDLAEALRWYRKAADQNLSDAQRFVGDMYAKGLGVPKDWKEAERWYAKAAANGDRQSQNLMKVSDSASDRKAAYEQAQEGKGPIQLGLRAVEVQDWLGVLQWAVPKGVRVTLGAEEVTPENGKAVVARLENEQRDLAASMEKIGVPDLAGDYILNEPPKDKCSSFQGKAVSYPVKVTIVQNKSAIELKSPEVYGCGVAVGKLVVLKAQGCGGTTPMRLLGAVSNEGIDDLSFLESASAPGLCHLGNLTRVADKR